MTEVIFSEQEQAQSLSLRNYLTNWGSKAVKLYSTTKEHSPDGLKSYIETVETKLVAPYIEPVKTQWKKHGDPVVTVLDSCLSEKILPQAKYVSSKVSQVQENILKPSEQYIRKSVHDVQNKVHATEEYLGAKKTAVINLVQNEVGRSGEYIKGVTNQVVTLAQKNKANLEDTANFVIRQADCAIDTYLPEEESESSEVSSPRMGKKLISRLRRRARVVYDYGHQRVKQIVHIDLVTLAKDTVGLDEAGLANYLNNFFSALSENDADYTQKVSRVVSRFCPVPLKPIVEKSLVTVSPVLNFTFSSLLKGASVVRNVVVRPSYYYVVPHFRSSQTKNENDVNFDDNENSQDSNNDLQKQSQKIDTYEEQVVVLEEMETNNNTLNLKELYQAESSNNSEAETVTSSSQHQHSEFDENDQKNVQSLVDSNQSLSDSTVLVASTKKNQNNNNQVNNKQKKDKTHKKLSAKAQ